MALGYFYFRQLAGRCRLSDWLLATLLLFTVPMALSPGASLCLAADYVDAPLPGSCTTPQYSKTEDYWVVGSATYRWSIGDGTFLTAATPPSYTYATSGAYVIKLVTRGPALADSTTRQTAVVPCQTYCTSGGWGGNKDLPLYFTGVQIADTQYYLPSPLVSYQNFTSYVATVHQGKQVAWQAEPLPFIPGSTGPWLIRTD